MTARIASRQGAGVEPKGVERTSVDRAGVDRAGVDRAGVDRAGLERAGKLAHRAGLAAEDQVAQLYARSGREIAARRWRGSCGEIDLIARDGAEVIFIEVKKSKTHARAAEHLTERQMARIYGAAAEFLGGEPRGQATDVRFDVALVDQFGRIELRQNVFAA